MTDGSGAVDTAAVDLGRRCIDVGLGAGLDAVEVCSASPFVETRDVLIERRDAGLAAGMQFTYRNPDRSTDPARALEGASALVVAALRYDRPLPEQPDRPVARVARYATQDHYAQLRIALDRVASLLCDEGHRAVLAVDDNALVDRAAAARAGLGWFGKSANVLLPRRGSWFVLGSVITDAPMEATSEPLPDGCGACSRCIDGCPTGAIVAPGVVDAGRCIAWLLQAEGAFPVEHREALGDRIYGCDECQEVCPPSVRTERIGGSDRSAAADDVQPGSWVDIAWVLSASDEALLDRLGRWYIPRRDPRYLRRNALVVAGNLLADDGARSSWGPELLAEIARHAAGSDPMLAEHARWAIGRAGVRA